MPRLLLDFFFPLIWVYDAEYVALARQLQVKLVTTDEKLLEQFPAVAVSPNNFLNA